MAVFRAVGRHGCTAGLAGLAHAAALAAIAAPCARQCRRAACGGRADGGDGAGHVSGFLLADAQPSAVALRGQSFNSIFSLINSQIELRQKQDQPLLPIGQDARLGASYTTQMRPPLLLLVLGETARFGNFGVNGYARATTPGLSALDADGALVSQGNAWSCGTNTATSLPCMFSHQDRAAHGDRVANHENLLDVLQDAGLAVLWIDNQSGCKGVCDRIAHTSTSD